MVKNKILTIRNKKVLDLFYNLKQKSKFISNTDFLNSVLNEFKEKIKGSVK